MSHLLSCTNLEKSFGPTPLFEKLSLSVHEGERVGLIGPNGAGKSTFLRMLAGQEDLDGGKIIYRKGLRVSYLPQSETFDESDSIDEILNARCDSHWSDLERHSRVGAVRNLIGLPEDKERIRQLSGGFRKRLAIASKLLEDPDLFLLDEPTNHLDLESIIWLEHFLHGAAFASIIISHDRTFLENVTTRTIEISRRYPEGFISVEGSYENFLVRREEIVEQLQRREQNLANSVRRETEWLRRQPKARTTKASARIQNAERLISELHQSKSRSRVATQAEVDFSSTGRQTKRLIVAEGISKSFGELQIVSGLDVVLTKGMKLGIVGRNGTGKSTLLKILSGELSVDDGKIWQAPNLRVVSFDQQRAGLNRSVSLKRFLAPESDSVVFQGRELHVASYAARYLFRANQLETQVSMLSGGEQARLLIAKLILEPADVLLLDEPTNDLDIDTLEALEESLESFEGAVVLISHDRKMIEGVCDLFLVMHDGKGEYVASFNQWEDLVSEPTQEPARKVGTPAALSTEEQRELKQMERSIEKAEKRVAQLEEQMAREIQEGKVVTDLNKKLAEATRTVESLYKRWSELAGA